MNRISNFQIYCLLVTSTVSLAYLITPMVVIHAARNGAWLAVLTSIIPGFLLVYVYMYIIKKSPRPFPALLEDCLGKVAGKIISFFYILVFLFTTAFTLRYFVALIGSSIVTDTPLSVYIGAMLLTGYYALKTGLENIARMAEIIVLLGLPLSVLLVFISLAQAPHVGSLIPILGTDYAGFGQAFLYSFLITGDMIAILALAHFTNDRHKVSRPVFMVLYTYIAIITITTMTTLLNFEVDYASLIAFPTFKLVRSITVSDFIQNIDVVFVCVWIIGIFAAITVKWYLACYTTQQVFALRDYRFLAAPTSVVIGIGSLMVGRNITEIQILVHELIPYVYGISYILIPFLVFIVLLFKPAPAADTKLDSPAA